MKRKKQRVMWLMFAVVFWLAGAGMALAAGNPQAYLRVQPQNDGTVKVSCVGTQIGNITNGKIRLYYDMGQVTLESAQKGSVLNNASLVEMNDFSRQKGEVLVVFASADVFSSEGSFLDVTFRPVAGVKAEDLNLRVAVEEMAVNGTDIIPTIGATKWEEQPADPGQNPSNGGNGNTNVTPSKTDIAGATVGNISNKVFNNKQKKPAVKVRVGGTLLKAGQDYTLTYKNNKKPGKATVVITGIGNYTGTKQVSFNITPKKTAVKKATSPKKGKIRLTWKRDSMATGYEIQCALNKSFKKGKKTVTVKKNKVTAKVINKCKSGKKYYVRIRSFKKIDGKKVYGPYSKKLTVKVK